MSYMIIGVHWLANKPLKDFHTQAWIAAIREELARNCSLRVGELSFELVYWADQHYRTIGSPLGLPTVAAHIHNEWGNLRTPSIVGKWVNLADPGDPVASDIHLNDDYEANAEEVKVQDDLILNNYADPSGKHNFHKIYRYLRCPEMSELIRGVM